MQADTLGNPVTGSDVTTLTAIDDFVQGFLSYETRAEAILKGADENAGSCLANAYAGLLWMLLEAPTAAAHANKYLQAARCAAAGATPRERLTTEILGAWVADDLPRALRLCDQASDEHPRDLAIVKLHQYFEFNRGNAPAMLRVALKVSEVNADVPYLHGMCAFAFEQCHLLDEAEQRALRALAMQRKEPWAQHALAHVMLTRGQIDAGAAFLEGETSSWTNLNSFMLTHLWWHLALFYLSQGRNAAALAAYDDHCWGVAKHYSQDQIGAVSLLARFDMAGIDVGGRWRELAVHLAPRATDTVLPFLTVQYLYGLARADRPEAVTLLHTVRDFARVAPVFSRAVWQHVALPACEGVYAHARGDYDRAWDYLSTAAPRLVEAGGSHAQRDLFEQMLIDAAVKSGRLVTAQQQLELRRHADRDGVAVNTALGSVYAKLGLNGLALEARRRAQATLTRHSH